LSWSQKEFKAEPSIEGLPDPSDYTAAKSAAKMSACLSIFAGQKAKQSQVKLFLVS
jgi:hypothetical protein